MNTNTSSKMIQDLYKRKDLNMLLDNEFVFSRKYDMEQCLSAVHMDILNWNFVPFDDDEWRWVFHRMEYCIDLGTESIQTEDLKYILHAKYLIFNFIENALYSDIELRTLDTGIRVITWITFLKHANSLNILSAKEQNIIKEAIKFQINSIYIQYKDTDQISNWGVIQCIAVLNAMTVISVEDEISNFFIKQYENHLKVQYYADGMQWEQSSIYIIEVTLKLLQMTNEKFKSEEYHNVLTSAFFALYNISDSNLNTIPLGDGDIINIEGILQTIAYITQNKDLLAYLTTSDIYEETFYLCGSQAATYLKVNQGKINTIKEHTNLLANSGIFTHKNEKCFFSFQNGPYGGGHGHNDNLHVNLSIHNQPILIDSGRFSYVNDTNKRQYFKETSAHNSFIFKNELVTYQDAWRSRSNYFYSPIAYSNYCKFIHTNASITSKEHFANRDILCFNNGDTLIFNSSFSNFEVNYILDHNLTPVLENKTIKFNNFKFSSFGNKSNVNIIPCWVSNAYNCKNESNKIKCSSENGQLINFIGNQHSEIKEIYDFEYIYNILLNSVEDSMRAFELISSNTTYIIFYMPLENTINNSAITYKGRNFVGKFMVYNQSEDSLTVLKN